MTVLLMLALACTTDGDDTNPVDDTEADADTDADGDSDTDADADNVPVSDASGSIELTDGSHEGRAEIAKAFYYSTSNKTFLYASSNPDATCAHLTQLYDKDAADLDKTVLFTPELCNLSVSLVGAPPALDCDIGDGNCPVIVNAQCTFGSDGIWEYDSGDKGYVWTGTYYEAGARSESISIDWHESEEGVLSAEVNLRGWEGTKSDDAGSFLARGSIKGWIHASKCDGLENLGGF
jgi:hypothetical protein